MSESDAHRQRSPATLVGRFSMIMQRFPELERRKMFGYPAAFSARGHMVTGLHGANWIVRLDEASQTDLRDAGGRDFEPMPGRPMKGFLTLPVEVMDDDESVAQWITRAAAHVATLPPKKPRKKKASKQASS